MTTRISTTVLLVALVAITADCGPPSDAGESPEALRVASITDDPLRIAAHFATSGRMFTAPLPIPGVIAPQRRFFGVPIYEIRMSQFEQDLGLVDAGGHPIKTKVWGYNGTYPGGTIEARRFVPAIVRWVNDLPDQHLLAIDRLIPGAETSNPDVRAVAHVHGALVPPGSDGLPDEWFPNAHFVGPNHRHPFRDDIYPNIQQAATLWYHDHAEAITRLNVYAGLAGFYLLRDEFEDDLNLPNGAYEIPMAIQDRTFNVDGSLSYPATWEPEFFGDTILVNGRIWPFLEVEPRRYRFRIVNGSTARFYHLKLADQASCATDVPSVVPFHQIGAEAGLLPVTDTRADILIGPGERADVIVDFRGLKGHTLLLTNDAATPYPAGDPPDPATVGQILQIRVDLPLRGRDRNAVPRQLRPTESIAPTAAVVERTFVLGEVDDASHRDPSTGDPLPKPLINGKGFRDAPTEFPKVGTVEIWSFINTTGDTHPMHPHQTNFKVLDRQPFDIDGLVAAQSTGQTFDYHDFLRGAVTPADDNERGFKDTVRANPGEVTRIIMRWGPFAGRSVLHCHILEHEENDMMRPFEILPR